MSDCSFSTMFIHVPPISMDCMVMWWKILQQLGSRRIGIGSGHRIHTQIGRLHLRNCQVKCADSTATGVVGILLGYFLVLNQNIWYHVTWWILVDLRIFRIRGFFWFFRSLWAHHSPWLCGQDLRLGQIGQQIQYNIGQTSNLNKSKNDMVQWSPTVHQQTCHWTGLREKTGPGNPHIQWSKSWFPVKIFPKKPVQQTWDPRRAPKLELSLVNTVIAKASTNVPHCATRIACWLKMGPSAAQSAPSKRWVSKS